MLKDSKVVGEKLFILNHHPANFSGHNRDEARILKLKKRELQSELFHETFNMVIQELRLKFEMV